MTDLSRAAGPRELPATAAWRARSAQVVPGLAQTFSKAPIMFVQGMAPNFLARSEGPYAWDVDGNQYIDWIMGLGSVTLGHALPEVNAAAAAQMALGISHSLPHTVEVVLAERLRDLIPCAEMVRFGKNGSDATAGAVRVARGFTGRDKVACCGYHGWQDWYIGSTSRHRGVPDAVRALTIPFPYNDLPALDRVFRDNPGEIACVIMEPMTFVRPPDGYLAEVRDLCHRNGALMILDETITGFRFGLGGAQELLGVTPDLACFGKAMANGFPISAIVGRADIMRLFEDVFFSFTFGGEAVSIAASLAVIDIMQREDVIGHLWRVGDRLRDAVNALAAECGVASRVECIGLGPWSTIAFRDAAGAASLPMRSLFQQEAMRRGILTLGSHIVSYSHTDAVVDDALTVYREAFGILAEAIAMDDVDARLVGPPMQAVFRQV